MDITFHYPPELMNLLIDTIPLLNRSKKNVLLFFKGAGVPGLLYADIEKQININSSALNKYEMTRIVLTRLNEKGEKTLRPRREVLKRVVEFEDFTTCWPNDQWKAKGLVSEIRKIVNVKDSFTKINNEREKERQKSQAVYRANLEAKNRKKDQREKIKKDLFALFSETNAHKRGKALETILNNLFNSFDILVRESFTLKGDNGEGIVEQIDGVIELDGHIYLVEMKWWDKPIGKGEVSQHLVRLFSRGDARGVFISASKYTDAAVNICKEALNTKVVILSDLNEIVFALEQEKDIRNLLRKKINSAVIDKNPYIFC